MPECKTCKATKPAEAFEKANQGATLRKECKECRKTRRKQAVTSRPCVTPDKASMPTSCTACGRGPPALEFKWRTDLVTPEWRKTCTSCYNDQGYHTAYRKREREKDEAAFLQRNAAQHLDWARRNPEKMFEQQQLTRTQADRKIKTIRSSAKQRGIKFAEIDIQAMAAKLPQPCRYCGHAPEKELCGLDRVDSRQGYTDANTVPACGPCNNMKGGHTLDMFVHLAHRIAMHRGVFAREQQLSEVPRPRPLLGSKEMRSAAATKAKVDKLSVDAKVRLWAAECYLCGRGPAMGIDRLDSSGDYEDLNTGPCCSDCNYMKSHHTVDVLDAHVRRIVLHMEGMEVGADVNNAPLYTLSKERRPVQAVQLHGGGTILFPSIGKAAEVIGVAPHTIENAMDQLGRTCQGCVWTTVTAAAYQQQHINAEAALRMLSVMRSFRNP